MRVLSALVILGVTSVSANPFPEEFIKGKIEEGFKNFKTLRNLEQKEEPTFFQRLTYQLGLGRQVEAPEPKENCNGTCSTCVKASVKHIMDSVVAAVKKECEETKCPILKKHCAMWAKHPQVSYGWLLGKVRPFSMGYAYCFGKGLCEHPKMKETAPVPKGMEQEFDNEEAEKFFDRALSEYGQPQDLIFAAKEETKLSFLDVVEGKKGKFGHCIVKTSICVIKHAVMRVKEFCEKTKCKHAQAKCAMIRAHPKVALGVLIYKVRPGEWACGYCFGDDKCAKKEEADGFLTEVHGYSDEISF
jgi:hypothetical protein